MAMDFPQLEPIIIDGRDPARSDSPPDIPGSWHCRRRMDGDILVIEAELANAGLNCVTRNIANAAAKARAKKLP